MKKIFTLLFTIGSYTLMAQTECDPGQVITTAPGSAVNTQKPTLVNHFDWTQSSFPLNAEQLASTSITSPFYQGPWNSNVANLVDSKDRLPADGWELINADFGYNNNGTPASQRVMDPKLLLYNKYTGTLRLFFAKGHTTTNDYNFIKISLSFYTTSGEYAFNTFTLSNSGILTPLDNSDFKSNPGKFQFMQDFQQTPGNWVYTDFPMHYDPCTCLFKSKIQIQISYLTKANVDLTGTFTGKLAAIDNGQGSITGPSAFNVAFKDVESTGKTIAKAFKSIDDFASDTKKGSPNGAALDALKTELQSSSFLKGLFSSVPFINSAVSVLDFFTGGGKSAGPQAVKLTPTSIDLSGKISGTITSEVINTTGVFMTPGSDPTGTDDTKYPLFNIPMGVLTLTKTPKIKWYRSLLESSSSDCCFTDVIRNDIVFDRSASPMFEYALNPGSGLHVKEVEAALVFEYSFYPEDYPPVSSYTPGWNKGYYDRANRLYYKTFVYEASDTAKKTHRYRTDYQPINCWAGSVLNVETQNSNFSNQADVIPHVYLKMKFNLEKNTGTGQNVLLIQTYDITGGIQYYDWDAIRHIDYVPDPSTWNYNVKPEPVLSTCSNTGANSNFKPATFASISSICNSTKYHDKHVNTSTAKPSRTGTASSLDPAPESSKTGVVYPNPSVDQLTLRTSASFTKDKVSVLDISSRKVTVTALQVNPQSNGTVLQMNVGNLSAGVYFIVIKGADGKPATYKFVKQ
ncbi:MAG: T9SS type A sorting domain-containing protein [Chitinophagaceae bacterium]|nr:T9SS type A sorting domain-containing protein [Chitinophagaceae bacterium]